jgi:hypothetical protein
MSGHPRDTWAAVRLLQAGSKSHHVRPEGFALHNPATGKNATTPAENLAILKPYCTKLYNRDDAPVDWSILDEIPQRPCLDILGLPPTLDDMMSVIPEMANNKAPGASGLPAEAIKALPECALKMLHCMISNFWTGDTKRYEEWKNATLRLLYKGKGDVHQPTNYRGIVLQDIFARVTSLLLTKRLVALLETCGIEEQFGSQPGRGTIDALYCLRAALHLRREHRLESHVLFVDLIKAFDTANHELLFSLLEKYGAPAPLVDAVRRLHEEFGLDLNLDNRNTCNIAYTVGVRQGDNMAPVLFLFIMQAMMETMVDGWKNNNRPLAKFQHHRTTRSGRAKGRLTTQPAPNKTKGQSFYLPGLLFVDDGAFVFETHEDTQKGAEFIRNHMARFGLLMHVGTKNDDGSLNASKTEAMYFPASPGNYKPKNELPPDLIFGDGILHVHYCREFKYLGCRITPLATDDVETATRIRQALNQIGALRNFFYSSADLRTKRIIFLAIPFSTATYGCESWTLNSDLCRRLTSFFHTAIRRMTRINMYQVKDYHIRNEHLRNKLSVPDPIDTVRRRQFNFLGRLARLPDHRLPRKFLTAWIQKPRHVGRPHLTVNHSFAESLRAILGEDTVEVHGLLQDWIPLAQNQAAWKKLGDSWVLQRMRQTMTAHGLHPLLGYPIYDIYRNRSTYFENL